MDRKDIIIAPHGDDEIIGCHKILERGSVRVVAFPFFNSQAVKESLFSAGIFGFVPIQFDTSISYILSSLNSLTNEAKGYGGNIFFPDPHTEYHPDHKLIGGVGMQLVLRGATNVIFYSTNMNAPYIVEVDNPELKRDHLNRSYPGKEDLWKMDHKYFLFEGYVNYNPIV